MKSKKIIIGMLLIVVFMAQISIISFNNFVFAEDAVVATVAIPTVRKASLNRPLAINSNVQGIQGTMTYQWYKDGVILNGKTNNTLTIDNVTEADAGRYKVKVTSAGKEIESNECNVTVRGFELSMVSTNSTVDLQKLEPGTEFDVNININNLKNVGKGLISLTGQFEYDSNILERKSITPKNGWEGLKINEGNLKFVIDNGAYVTQSGEMLTIKFKVKDTIKENKQTAIKVKGITASGGDGVISTRDVQLGIGIKMPEVPPVVEKITSDVYVIDNKDKDISRIAPGTTVAKFKENVETEQQMVFTNKAGETLAESDVLATGMKIKVGKTLEYTLIVTGDIDGDGIVAVNDLAKVKLHIIEKESLTGIYLKAGDVDNDKGISVNDCAQIKLVMINLFEIK